MSGNLPRVLVQDVIAAACALGGLRRDELIGKRRYKKYCYWRQRAMWVSRDLTQRSYPHIGHAFGGRDHTTVLFAYRKIARLRNEPAVVAELEQLTEAAVAVAVAAGRKPIVPIEQIEAEQIAC